MHAERLLQRFDRISEAPDAISRLRQFILDLAVRGKLVEQDPSDEPASELLKRIQAEKEKLVARRRIRQEKDVEYSLSQGEALAPKEWLWVHVNDVALVQGGKRLPQGATFSKEPTPHIYIRVTDMKDGTILMDDLQFIAPEVQRSNSPYIINKEDLYVTIAGTIGQVGLITGYFDGQNLTENAAKIVFRALNTEFFRLVLSSDAVQQQFRDKTKQMAQPKLALKRIAGARFPLPPLAEQHRIVSKVDELMGLCDQLEAAQTAREQSRDRLVAACLHRLNSPADTAETDTPDLPAQRTDTFRDHARFVLEHLPRLTTCPEHIKQLRQTFLNLAARGKLVPQDSADEPASELLKRIQTEKERFANNRVIKRLKVTPLIDTAEVPFFLPETWVWVRLGDLLLGDSQNGYSKKPDDAIDGIPILRISAGTVRKDGIVAEEEHKLIGGIQPTHQEQYQLQPGDLLACRFNGNRSFVGRLSLYLGYLGIKPIYPDKLIRLRLLSGFVLPKLVRCFAESSVVRRDIEGYCATTVGNRGISASNLKEVKIPLPPLAEQHRIVARVDELMALCDQLEAQLTTTEADSRRLLEAVLHEALNPLLEVTE